MLALTSTVAVASVFLVPAESNLEDLHPFSSSFHVFGSVPNQTSSGATKHDMNPNGVDLGPVTRSAKNDVYILMLFFSHITWTGIPFRLAVTVTEGNFTKGFLPLGISWQRGCH